MQGDNPYMTTRDTEKWEWRIMTAHFNNDGKLRFDDIGYYWMPEKKALASLKKEGWELVRVVPITPMNPEDITHKKHKFKGNLFSRWFKKSRNFFDTTLFVGKSYYFKRLVKE
jgi:hypothetical protein